MKRNGTLIGLGSGLFWGLDTVLLGIATSSALFLTTLAESSPLITTFLHDGASFAFLMIIILVLGKHKQFLSTLRSKAGLIIIGAALLGGPIGMTGYILSIRNLGPSISASISAIYPAFGLILGYIILKEKLKPRAIVGIILSIAAIVFMGLSTIGDIPDMMAGLFFALMCVIGWGSEAVIIGAALKDDVPAEIALAIRQMVSFLTYGLIIIPIIGYDKISLIGLTNPRLWLILFTGVIGSISYLFYYKAIALIGPGKAMGLNITYPAWAFLFSYIFMGDFDFKTLIFVIIIFIGAIMSMDDPTELIPFLKTSQAEVQENS